MNQRFNGIGWVVRQRAFYVSIVLWLLLCGVGLLFSRQTPSYRGLFTGSSEYLVLVVLMFGLVALLMRKRPVIDLALLAPESSIARRETLAMWAGLCRGRDSSRTSDRAALVWRRDCPASEWVAGRGLASAVTD